MEWDGMKQKEMGMEQNLNWNRASAVFNQIQVPWLLAQQSSLKKGKSKLKLLGQQYAYQAEVLCCNG